MLLHAVGSVSMYMRRGDVLSKKFEKQPKVVPSGCSVSDFDCISGQIT